MVVANAGVPETEDVFDDVLDERSGKPLELRSQVIGLMRSLTGMSPFVERCTRVNCMSPYFTESGSISSALRNDIPGVPVNRASTVGNAILYLTLTPGVTGRNIYIADNLFTGLEEPLFRLRPEWLGKSPTELLRKPVEAEYMTAGHYIV